MSDDPAKTKLLPDGPAGELPVGAELSQGMYRVTGRIAAGGFGITYEARDNLDRKVAIKECFPAGLALRAGDFTVSAASASTAEPFETARNLFLREARTLATLRHPNIVHVQTLFEENGTAYMAMDYIDGRDLQHVITHEPEILTPAYVMELTRALLAAMDYLHRDAPERGKERLLHRDIKPANIRIDQLDTPVVIDFGAARQETKNRSRAAGTFRVVSDGYSPNEFYVAGTEQGPASDLYSLAATLHHCIAGVAPAPADERAQKVSNGEEDPYQPIAGRFPSHDPRLLALIDRALSRPLRDRPADASAWFAAIPDATTRIITPVPVVPEPVAATPKGAFLKGAVVGGLALAVLGGGGVAMSGFGEQGTSDSELRRQLDEAQSMMTGLEADLAEMSDTASTLQSNVATVTDARDLAQFRADELGETVADLREQLSAAGEGDDAQTNVLRSQLNQALTDQEGALDTQRTLEAQIQELQAALEEARAAAAETPEMGPLISAREEADAAREAADLAATRAQADMQRMANYLEEAEAEADRLSMELRTARAEIDLMTASPTAPNPGTATAPIPPTPTGACPTWENPGAELRFTGMDIYNPQTLTTQASGTRDISDCDGLPFDAAGHANAAPNYTLYLTEMAQFRRVQIRVTSECDTTLLVNSHDTIWHFDDDSNGGVLPMLNITGQQAIEGRVDVWVGTFDGDACEAVLELAAWIN